MQKKRVLRSIPIAIIRKSPLHWDRTITEEDLEDLASSIDSVGIIHPITVRKNGRLYEYLAGERRFLACKSRGLKEIPCSVVICSDSEARELSLVENLKVVRPRDSEWKAAVQELFAMESRKMSKIKNVPKAAAKAPRGRPANEKTQVIKTVAKVVGVHPKTVEEVLNHEKLIPTARLQFERGNITAKQARSLVGMTVEDQRVQISNMISQTKKNIVVSKLNQDKAANSDPTIRAGVRAFLKLQQRCLPVTAEVDSLRDAISNKCLEVIYKENRDALVDLHRSISQLLRDIELVENAT